MVDLLTLLGTLGGGITDVISQSSELVVATNGTTKILTLNLSGYLSSSHEASHVGAANVAFGAFDINTQTVTLQNSSGVTVGLSVDLGGNLMLCYSTLIIRRKNYLIRLTDLFTHRQD